MSISAFWFLIKTIPIGLILSVLSIPDQLAIAMPFWVMIIYSYCIMYFGINTPAFGALIIGMMLDVAVGDIFGQHALALILSSLFIVKVYQAFFISNRTTQVIYIAISAGIYLATISVVYMVATQRLYVDPWALLSIATTALIYLPLAKLLNLLRDTTER